MKISTRLSISFTLIANLIFIVSGIAIYFFSSNYRKQDFVVRMKKRVEITEKVFLEKDSFGAEEFKVIKEQFLHTLPDETEEVIEIEAGSTPIFKYSYAQESVDEMLIRDSFIFEKGDVQGMSKVFHVKGKDFLIIVTAIDKVGLHYLSYLKGLIAFWVLVGIALISGFSTVLAKRALMPISKKINKANSISASNLHHRLQVHNANDELGKMAIAFNKLLDRLESSFVAQKSFIRNASHEIRTPLTAIMGEAEIAISKPRTADVYRESLASILVEAETLNATVNNLLQLSKIEGGEEQVTYEMIQFDVFLVEVKESFDFLNPQNQLELSGFESNEKDDFLIFGNRNLLKSVLINLFDNACKFSENKRVAVVLSRENLMVRLHIVDEGIGIPKEDLEKVTDPFYRGNNAMQIRGSGIGLSLCAGIIGLHAGTLVLQSEIGLGTAVWVSFPLAVREN
ncbi:MAG TPA: HAMP domain-containing protein [Bacteroidetes bacterium]|nr:HAMP domain-containing protein [Bacteroidota bacterium]